MLTRKKLMASIGVVIMAVMVLSACAQPTAETIVEKVDVTTEVEVPVEVTREVEVTVQPPQEPVTISFYTIAMRDFAEEWMLDMIAQFEAKHPNIKIDWIDGPGQFREYMIGAITTNTLADVVDVDRFWGFADWIDMGALMPLDGKIPQEFIDDMVPGRWDAGAVSGKHYGLPWFWYSRVTWYNRCIFEEAGLDPDKPPTTFDEAIEMSQVIREKTGKYGLALYLSDWTTTPIFYSDGMDFLSEDWAAAGVNTPETAAMLQKWIDAYNEGLYAKEAVATGEEAIYTDVNQLYTGQAAILYRDPWNSGPPPEDIATCIDVAPGLVGTRGVVDTGGHMVTVNANTEHPEEALEFLAWVTSPEMTLSWVEEFGGIPPYQSAIADPSIQKRLEDPEDVMAKAGNLTAFETRGASLPLVPHWQEMQRYMYQELTTAWLGQETPEEALTNIETEWNRILAGE